MPISMGCHYRAVLAAGARLAVRDGLHLGQRLQQPEGRPRPSRINKSGPTACPDRWSSRWLVLLVNCPFGVRRNAPGRGR